MRQNLRRIDRVIANDGVCWQMKLFSHLSELDFKLFPSGQFWLKSEENRERLTDLPKHYVNMNKQRQLSQASVY